MVKRLLRMDGWTAPKTAFNCGDQKLIYSYFNRGDTSPLPYSFAGRNYNTVSDFLLN